MQEVGLALRCFTWQSLLLLLPTHPARSPTGQEILGCSFPGREILLQGGKPWCQDSICFGEVLVTEKKATFLSFEEFSFFLFTMYIIGNISLTHFLPPEVRNNVGIHKMFWSYNHHNPFSFSLTCKFAFTNLLIVL